MSSFSQFAGGEKTGQIVQGVYPGNSRYLACDGLASTTAFTDQLLGDRFPEMSSASLNQHTSYSQFLPINATEGSGVTVVVGSGVGGADVDYCLTSEDGGTTWSSRKMPAKVIWNNVLWNGQLFVATGRSSTSLTTIVAAYSKDGYDWSQSPSTFGNNNFGGIASNGSRWVLVPGMDASVASYAYQDSTTTGYYSDDGVNWNAMTLPFDEVWSGVTYNAVYGTYIACGEAGCISYSYDGINWLAPAYYGGTKANYMTYVNCVNNFSGIVCRADGLTVAVDSKASSTAHMLSSDGGLSWYSYTMGYRFISNENFRDLRYGNGVWMTLSEHGIISRSDDAGATWKRVQARRPFQETSVWSDTTVNFTTIAYGNGKWVAYGNDASTGAPSNGNILVYSTDNGLTWVSCTFPNTGYSVGTYIVYANGRFVLTSNAGNGILTSTDGITFVVNNGAIGDTNVKWTRNLAYVNSKWILHRIGSTLYHSTDGATWTAATATGQTASSRGIAFGGTTYVVCDGGGHVSSSTDLTTWTDRSAAAALGVHANTRVVYGASLFVAIGASGVIRTSPDAVVWTTRTNPLGTSFLNDIVYDNGTFIITASIASGANILTSTDGTNWASKTTGVSSPQFAAFGGSRWIVSTFAGHTAYSDDNGNTWTSSNVIPAVDDVALLGSTLVGPSTLSSSNVLKSSDGLTWSTVTAPVTFNSTTTPTTTINSTNKVSKVGSKVAVMPYSAANYNSLCLTSDATSFSTVSLPRTSVEIRDIAYSSTLGLYCAVGASNGVAYIATSPDNVTWTERATPTTFTPLNLRAIEFGNGVFVAGSSTSSFEYLTSTDGINWTERLFPGNINIRQITFGAGRFLVTNTSNIVYHSTDGINWSQYSLTSFGMAWNGTVFVSVTNSTTPSVSSDGITFTAQSAQVQNMQYVSVVGTTFVSWTTGGSAVLTSLNGTTWTSVALNGTLPAINTPNNSSLSTLSSTSAILTVYNSNTYYHTTNSGTSWTARTLPTGVSAITRSSYSGTSSANNVAFTHPAADVISFATTDGINWSARAIASIPPTGINQAIKFGTKTVAVVNDARPEVMTLEANASEWKTSVFPLDTVTATFGAIGTDGSKIIALGTNPSGVTYIVSSTDAVNWTKVTAPSTLSSGLAWKKIVWTGTYWFAVSSTSISMTSTNGTDWTLRTLPFVISEGSSLAGAGGKLVALVKQGANPELSSAYYTSTDGITWTLRSALYEAPSAVASDGTKFLMGFSTPGNTVVCYGTDAINWTATSFRGFNTAMQSPVLRIEWTGTFFALLTNTGVVISRAGTTWSNYITVDSNTDIAVTGTSTIAGYSNSSPNLSVASFNTSKVVAPNLNSIDSSSGPFYQYSLVIG